MSGKIAETVLVAGLEDDDEYFERIRGIKNNFSRLVSIGSQIFSDREL